VTTIALFGAAGKMGTRISERLLEDPRYRTLFVEATGPGLERLRQRGLTPTPQEDAVRQADVVILAIPDALIGKVAAEIVPSLRPGAMVICLDPAAPYSGELPPRDDISYFVTHPCHPPIVSDEVDPAARGDLFGGIARQSIVCVLIQGTEDHYVQGERIARCIFAPVLRVHRVTLEQMALLEPAMAETVILTCMVVIREAVEEAVRRGVPPEAARDFALGHIGVDIGILFGFIDAQLSDGARLAVERGRQRLLQPDWRKVFEPQSVLDEVRAITHAHRR
jgi:hypothetical protein